VRLYPKAKSLGVVVYKNHILVEEFSGSHSLGEGIYYRLIGGAIEFGETSEDALLREFVEELNVEITIKQYLGCLENIFTIRNEIGHEIIQLYSVEFKDTANYESELFVVTEGNKSAIAKWISIDEFIWKRKIIYPNGIVERFKDLIECV
jgi:8-oxo-dGTP pyrophosphatase MutT (NUDIX family)